MSKPIVIFTNFFDAMNLIKGNDLFITRDNKLYRVYLKKNFKLLSVTLNVESGGRNSDGRHSDVAIQKKHFETLNCLVPTTRNLTSLSIHKNWDRFINDYRDVLRNRKSKILSWIDSLEDNKVYFCCCFEFTGNGLKCHRKVLYDTFSNGVVKDKAIWIYRHGAEVEFDFKAKNNDVSIRDFDVVLGRDINVVNLREQNINPRNYRTDNDWSAMGQGRISNYENGVPARERYRFESDGSISMPTSPLPTSPINEDHNNSDDLDYLPLETENPSLRYIDELIARLGNDVGIRLSNQESTSRNPGNSRNPMISGSAGAMREEDNDLINMVMSESRRRSTSEAFTIPNDSIGNLFSRQEASRHYLPNDFLPNDNPQNENSRDDE